MRKVVQPLVLIWLVGLFVSIALAIYAGQHQDQLERHNVSTAAAHIAHEVGVRVRAVVSDLHGLRGFLSGGPVRDGSHLRAFVATHRPDPSTITLVWAPRVSNRNRPAFEAELAARREVHKTIVQPSRDGLVKAEARAVYFPVQYQVSFNGATTAEGLDLFFGGERNAGLVSAWLSGQAAIGQRGHDTSPVAQNHFMQRLPVYAGPDFSKRRLIGYVAGVFSIERMFGDLQREPINFQILDRTVQPQFIAPAADGNVVFSSGSLAGEAADLVRLSLDVAGGATGNWSLRPLPVPARGCVN